MDREWQSVTDRQRVTEWLTDRQRVTDRVNDRQRVTDRQTDWQRLTDRQRVTEWLTDRQRVTERQREWQSEWQIEWLIDRDRQTEWMTDWQTEWQMESDRQTESDWQTELIRALLKCSSVNMPKNCQKADVKNLWNTEKDENKREGWMGAKPCDGKRKMSQKKQQVKQKTETYQ